MSMFMASMRKELRERGQIGHGGLFEAAMRKEIEERDAAEVERLKRERFGVGEYTPDQPASEGSGAAPERTGVVPGETQMTDSPSSIDVEGLVERLKAAVRRGQERQVSWQRACGNGFDASMLPPEDERAKAYHRATAILHNALPSLWLACAEAAQALTLLKGRERQLEEELRASRAESGISPAAPVRTEGSGPAGGCGCYRCTKERTKVSPPAPHEMLGSVDMRLARMFLCETCGNKRCPHAADHRHACTGSNAPGQPGSLYEAFP